MTGKTLAAVIVTCLVVLVLGGIIIADILGGDGESAGALVGAIVTILAGVGAAIAAGRLPGSGQRGFVTVHRLAVVAALALGLVALMAFTGCAGINDQTYDGDVAYTYTPGEGGGIDAKGEDDPEARWRFRAGGTATLYGLCSQGWTIGGVEPRDVPCGGATCTLWLISCVEIETGEVETSVAVPRPGAELALRNWQHGGAPR